MGDTYQYDNLPIWNCMLSISRIDAGAQRCIIEGMERNVTFKNMVIQNMIKQYNICSKVCNTTQVSPQLVQRIYQSLLQLQVHSTTNNANNNKKVIFFTSVAW